jgi:hypothetical protein
VSRAKLAKGYADLSACRWKAPAAALAAQVRRRLIQSWNLEQGRIRMGARQKLNSGYFLGSLLAAGLIGLLLQSWLVLVFALVVLVAINLNNGDIRFGKRRR